MQSALQQFWLAQQIIPKLRSEATDEANIRSLYAEVSADAITADTNDTVEAKTVASKQTQAKWQSQGNAEKIDIGGQQVDAKVDGAEWTISATKGTDGTYTVTIK